jgi:hypothetical protein
MRLLIAATLAASLIATDLFAAETTAALPAGTPAGVAKAQGADADLTWYVLGGLVVLGLAIGLASSGNSHLVATPPAATTTTST